MSETLRDLVVSLSLNSDNFTRNIKSNIKSIQLHLPQLNRQKNSYDTQASMPLVGSIHGSG